ncbi:hypothetical protein KR222_005291, partial [Zaprionus bogoriensis]
LEMEKSISIFCSVAVFLFGYNFLPDDLPPDLPSVMFLSQVVLLLIGIRSKNILALRKFWLFPIYLAALYLSTQIVIVVMWNPLWFVVERIVDYVFDSETIMKLSGNAPSVYKFMKSCAAYTIKAIFVIILTYDSIADFFMS